MDSTSQKSADDNESDGSGSESTLSDTTFGVSCGKEISEKLMAQLKEKIKELEGNKEDNKKLLTHYALGYLYANHASPLLYRAKIWNQAPKPKEYTEMNVALQMSLGNYFHLLISATTKHQGMGINNPFTLMPTVLAKYAHRAITLSRVLAISNLREIRMAALQFTHCPSKILPVVAASTRNLCSPFISRICTWTWCISILWHMIVSCIRTAAALWHTGGKEISARPSGMKMNNKV